MLVVALLTPPVMLAAVLALGRYEERLLGAPAAGPARRPAPAPPPRVHRPPGAHRRVAVGRVTRFPVRNELV
ncbi:hypothetical protein GCM10010347_27790 [Streptomyces cirratus]|uniref:Uncharacterized protein n=1 Tax=Streptomyces cirratus TaxID=68187 RepID=A0ABQ3EZQ0_9ACTN|nr:hypothetical protein [Streptomyces cirratus]GHB56178.1 hypothetical protein GCM10010347_27790 [Streptomyces cirratus]